MNFKVLIRSCIVPCPFLELGVLSGHLFNGYFPIFLLGSSLLILLLELILVVLLGLVLLLIMILNRTLFLNIPVMIFPGEFWMILPTWVLSIRVGIVLI